MSITLAELDAMTVEERWALIDGAATRVSASELGIKPCRPNYIDPLYTNTPFPHYATQDGTTIQLDADNIYNGTLVDIDEKNNDHTEMRWRGYTCQLYDGELKMCPEAKCAESVIQGTCHGVDFKFVGTTREYGCLPGFLSLYKSPDRSTMTLHEAAQYGALERVRRCIEVDGVDPNCEDEYGRRALYMAAMVNQGVVVEYLLQKRACVECGSGDNVNPFSLAVVYSHNAAIEAFIDGRVPYPHIDGKMHEKVRRIYARRRRCRRAAAATYVAHAGVFPKDLLRLMAKAVWSTRFEKTWLKGE